MDPAYHLPRTPRLLFSLFKTWEKFWSCDWTPISSLEGSLGAKRKMRSYDMGCDCGKRRVTDTEKEKCKESAQLEAPDQVCKFDAGKPGPSLAFEYKKLLTARRWWRQEDKKERFSNSGGMLCWPYSLVRLSPYHWWVFKLTSQTKSVTKRGDFSDILQDCLPRVCMCVCVWSICTEVIQGTQCFCREVIRRMHWVRKVFAKVISL